MLYPSKDHITPTLKLFRREPAITKFDWLFTAYHRSSPRIVRRVGSGLLQSFDYIHPAHGKLTWLRVLCMLLIRAINTRFPCDSIHNGLSLATCINSLAHSSIGTPSRNKSASTPCRHMVSGLFQRPLRATFHLSLTVLVHYRSPNIFSLTG